MKLSAFHICLCYSFLNLCSTSSFVLPSIVHSRLSLRNNYPIQPIPSSSFRSESSSDATVQNNNKDDAQNEEDEEDCNIKGLFGTKKNIYLISDRMGTLSKTVLKSSLAQFEFCDDRYTYDILEETTSFENDYNDSDGKPCNVHTRIFTFVQNMDTLDSIFQKAQEETPMVLFTMADPPLRNYLLQKCQDYNLPFVDLLGPTLSSLTTFLGRPPSPSKIPSLADNKPNRQGLSEKYYRRIEAVEFTLQADDGQAPWLLKDADIVLVGVSRTGKTPLSVLLSQTQGFKVANVPLVLECPFPSELSALNPDRVFCLTISPTELKRIRRTRLERRNIPAYEKQMWMEGSDKQSNYGDRAYVLQDLKNARKLAEDKGWTEVDVTGRAVEESASYICELMNERFRKHNIYR